MKEILNYLFRQVDHLGYFDTSEQAKLAYREAYIREHGKAPWGTK